MRPRGRARSRAASPRAPVGWGPGRHRPLHPGRAAAGDRRAGGRHRSGRWLWRRQPLIEPASDPGNRPVVVTFTSAGRSSTGRRPAARRGPQSGPFWMLPRGSLDDLRGLVRALRHGDERILGGPGAGGSRTSPRTPAGPVSHCPSTSELADAGPDVGSVGPAFRSEAVSSRQVLFAPPSRSWKAWRLGAQGSAGIASAG